MTKDNAQTRARERFQCLIDDGQTREEAIAGVAASMAIKTKTVRRYLTKSPGVDPTPELGPAVSTEDVLRSRVKDLERTLRGAKKEAVSAHSVREYILGLKEYSPQEPLWTLPPGPDALKSPGTPMLMLSDFHWGEVVTPEGVFGLNSYDMATAQLRLRTVIEKTIGILHTYINPPNFPGIVVVLGGDMVSGNIHDDLTATNEREIMPVVLDCAENLTAAIRKLHEAFGIVYVVGVPGNHGRNTMKPRMKFYAETNFDWLIYQLVERFVPDLVEIGGVVFNCPAARDVTITVAERRFRITHGDQFKGGDGVIGPLGPITRGDMRKRSVAMSMPHGGEGYDTLLCGHFHRLMMLPRLIVNGSLKGYDEFAMAHNFEFEPPQQALWIVHPRLGANYYIPLIADPEWRK